MNRNIDALSFHLPKGENLRHGCAINSIDLAQQTSRLIFVFSAR